MRIASLDTSTRICGVALIETDDATGEPAPVFQASDHASGSRATRLLPLLEVALIQVGWNRRDVELFVAVRGPGSFTGLRIGLGTVRGLALASGASCRGVATFDAMAAAFGPAEHDRVPVIDAGRGEVFACRLDAGSMPPREVGPPWVGTPAALIEALDPPVVLFGNGVERYELQRSEAPGVRFGAAPDGVAAAAGVLAALASRGGESDDDGMSPLYVRAPDAAEPGDAR